MAITTKIWTGSPSERFTHADMNRVTANANTVASLLGYRQETFAQVTRSSQLDLNEVNRLERMLQGMSDLLGLGLTMVTSWTPGRSVSAVDFNRWEQACSAIESGVSDGKVTLRVSTGVDAVMPLDWTLSDSSGVVASGSSWTGDLHFRLPSGMYTFQATGFGESLEATAQATSNIVLNISSLVSVVTISCSMPMSSITIRDTTLEASGQELSVGMVRSSTEHTITAQVVNDSPIYSGVASGLLWDYKTESTFTPSAASVAVPLTPVREGVPLIVPRDGTLVIPQLARFHLTAIGGGLSGDPSYYGGSERYSGKGGRGGGISMLPDVTLSDRIAITIGAGQTSGVPAGDTSVEDPSGTVLMTAKAGEGAGGGGAYYWDTTGAYAVKPTSGGPYTGGGGAGYRGTSAGAGGSGGGAGGIAGSSAYNGKDGTIIDGQGYGGVSAYNAGGGGGGYGADGGDCGNFGGGGGGGAFGGTGGNGGTASSDAAGHAGLGYGAGGGGGGQSTLSGGGGGGGLETVQIATDGSSDRVQNGSVYTTKGGDGASGAVRIVYIGD